MRSFLFIPPLSASHPTLKIRAKGRPNPRPPTRQNPRPNTAKIRVLTLLGLMHPFFTLRNRSSKNIGFQLLWCQP